MTEAEQAEFERLWAAHHRRVLAYALRRADRDAAQDVVSETFLTAWRRRGDMPADALPWLLGVARRSLANHARGQRRREALHRVFVDQAAQGPGRTDEIDHELLHALAALAPPDREALLLIGWDGLTPAEAALVVGCSAATFRVRLLRARRRLAGELARAGVAHPTPLPEAEATS